MTLRPQLLAHRGFTLSAPENTATAILASLSRDDIDGLELDVQLTADGVPVVFHDTELERLTGTTGRLEAWDYAALEALRVDGHPIPRLDQLIARDVFTHPRGPAVLNVELKPTSRGAELVTACLPALSRLDATPEFTLVVSSFDPRVVAACVDQASPGRLAFLYEDPAALAALPHLASEGRTIDLHPRHTLIDAAHLAEYAAPGRVFRTWTVDDPTEARRLIGLGVTQIISNVPHTIAGALAREETP